MNCLNKYVIHGGKPIYGEVTISGAKNAAAAIIPAALLVDGVCRIENIPNISDAALLMKILKALGADIRLVNKNTVDIDCSGLSYKEVPYELMRKIRASYYFLGSMLGRYGKARASMPGGCNFGVRPIDQHIKGFNALGARVEVKSGIIHADTQEHGIKGNHVYLDIASVGATINIMLAAVLGEGRTVIENAAKEPHIVDVANFLNSMGADIKGAGTSLIKIDGVSGLHGGFYSIIPDQIEAGTYVAAVAGTGGEILIKNVIPKHLECITAKFQEMGIYIEERGDAVLVGRDKPLKNANVKTMFYPGFPTDMQPQITAVLCQAEGTSIITEEVYKDSNRFKYVEELKKMGAHIHVDGRIAIVQGVEKLTGAPVKACDLRAGAAMVIAGLCAQGRTDIEDIYHIERGYENIVSKLRGLGASIARVKVSSPDEGVLREVLA